MQLIDEANPPKGLFFMSVYYGMCLSILKTDSGWLSPGMQIRKNCEEFLCYEQSQLDLIEITRDTPTTLGCETIDEGVEKISETISFRIKG